MVTRYVGSKECYSEVPNKRACSLRFLRFFSTILANIFPARLSNSINKFVLPARLFQNQYFIFKNIPAYSFIPVCSFMNFEKNASLLVYSGLLIY